MPEAPKPQIRSYRDLNVWQKAVELAQETYRLAKKLPKGEEHGLASQMRRATISIAANIAEGHGRRGNREFARFLGIAHGSLVETETLLHLGHMLGYYTAADVAKANELASHTGAMLWGLTRALDKQARGGAAAVSRQSSALAAAS